MATINNSDLFKELKEGIKLQQLRDVIPSQLADKVVPVMEVNPKLLRRTNLIKSQSATANSNTTIYTTPTDKDFFLTNFVMQGIKDAVCDMATGQFFYLTVVIDGATTSLAPVSGITLTAQSERVVVVLAHPLKIDKGTNIILARGGAFAAGVFSRSATIMGYLVENINA